MQPDAIVIFAGGPLDGLNADTRDAPGSIPWALATLFFLSSDGGRQVGKVIKGVAPAVIEWIAQNPKDRSGQGFALHGYAVEGREEGERVVIRALYCGAEPPKERS